jgi:anti-sigma B factor antagonist
MPSWSVWKLTEVAHLDGDRLLVLQGELDIATAPELAATLARIRAHHHAVVLDLEGVTFMDSTGLTTLMDAWLEAGRDGWGFSVRAVSAPVRRVVALAGAERLLGNA